MCICDVLIYIVKRVIEMNFLEAQTSWLYIFRFFKGRAFRVCDPSKKMHKKVSYTTD